MTAQPSLFSAQKAPKVSDQDVAWLMRVLDGKGWWTAKQIQRVAYLKATSDRTLRAIAAESKGQIISGQRGYHLTSQASVEDVNHFLAWMRSQSERMRQRAAETQQVLNGRLSGAA